MGRPAQAGCTVAASHHASTKNLSLLVVDSDDERRHRLVGAMSGRGWHAMTARGSDEVRLPLLQAAFDVVMVQLRLRDGNGFDLLPTIRRCNETVPIVIWFQPTYFVGLPEPRSIWFLRGSAAPPLIGSVERCYRDFVRREGRRLDRQETIPVHR
jgi:hypothetical protein